MAASTPGDPATARNEMSGEFRGPAVAAHTIGGLTIGASAHWSKAVTTLVGRVLLSAALVVAGFMVRDGLLGSQPPADAVPPPAATSTAPVEVPVTTTPAATTTPATTTAAAAPPTTRHTPEAASTTTTPPDAAVTTTTTTPTTATATTTTTTSARPNQCQPGKGGGVFWVNC
ncbi:MAG: hypothetical protein HOV94_01665 [Saccharothrix sp.]|nr:hypothetical protein [Saccharothrix sp.]